MKISDLFRLVKKHIVLLLLIPLLLGAAVAYKTTDTFSSRTTLYTGLTSGTNVQIDQSFNLFTTNASFDNLINIIQSRETSQEVALRLLAQHLMLGKADPRYISQKSWEALETITPRDVEALVVRKASPSQQPMADSSLVTGDIVLDTTFSFADLNTGNTLNLQPRSINPAAFEQTVNKLRNFMLKDDTNFIYRLLNGSNPHYSIKAISAVDVQRISSSDLIEMKYNSDDPGICQQTLAFLTETCMKNYKKTKETRSDAVVKYFEFKVKEAGNKLNAAEEKLLRFNQSNNIVNYEDQSRAAASSKSSLITELQNNRIKLAGQEATVQQLEEKMNSQQKVQANSTNLINKRNELADINSRIATAESAGFGDPENEKKIADLKAQSQTLNAEIGDAVTALYNSSSSVQGMTGGTLMNTYLENVKDLQQTKATIGMLQGRIKDSEREYSAYEPAGVNLKRIDREVSIAEREYMELLHGLNLAKLKVQDVELSSNIKAVDPPYYPISPNATKRLMMIVAAVLFGFLLVFSTILAMEYFDSTLRNPKKASKILQLQSAGIYPKLTGKTKNENLPLVTNRLLEMIIQQIELYPTGKPSKNTPRTVLFFSTLDKEGKTVLMGNIAQKLKEQGKKVISVNFSGESLMEAEILRMDPNGKPGKQKDKQLKEASAIALPAEDIIETSTIGEDEDYTLDMPESVKTSEEHLIYQVDERYHSINNYLDLVNEDQDRNPIIPDYVLIELPPLLHHPYPSGLVATSDLAVMVCRSNRSWSEADQGALDTFKKLTRVNPMFILNGVESQVVKSMIGSLPKKRRGFRRKVKKMANS